MLSVFENTRSTSNTCRASNQAARWSGSPRPCPMLSFPFSSPGARLWFGLFQFSSIFTLTLEKYGHFHFSSGASCLMVRRMGSSKSKPCNWWVFSFYSNLISAYVLIDNLFKILFNVGFSGQYALHPPRYYLHVDWERLSDTQVIVDLKLIRNNTK